MRAKKFKKNIVSTLGMVAVFFAATSIYAEAGKSLFVYGKVEVRDSAGEMLKMQKGMSFDSGDTIVTGINGRTQIRMNDGAIFDLKPNTEFVIEKYQYKPAQFEGSKAATDDSKGFYKLLRGGFRAISGAIGKKNKKNYKVTTPVATIGIRGTDYTLQFCASDCRSNGFVVPNGLYASVLEGGITLDNQGGYLDVDPGQVAFVSDILSAPVFTGAQVKADASEEDAPPPSINREGEDMQGNVVSIESGQTVNNDAPAVDPSTSAVRAAFTNGSQARLATGIETDPSGHALRVIDASAASYDQGTAESINRGVDQPTGLYWGRWANGSAVATAADGSTSTVDLNNSSMHWIHSSNQIKPELPLTGTASFTLVGNTNPTDNLGNRGVLGSAGLTADFTNQTVDADVNLSINNQTWDAQANDVALDGEAATFAGEFDQVTVTNDDSGAQHAGDGSLAGFFSGDDEGNLNGAGMTYTLEDGESTVEGAAAFEVDPDDKP